MANTIGSAPLGQNTSLAGTEKVPLSGSQYTLLNTIKSWLKTANDLLYMALVAPGTSGNVLTSNGSVWVSAPLANRNVIINGGFTINQRAYVSAVALAAGVYGHDRWKAGSGGGDYSFTQLASPTTITIAANKTLIQVIEDKNVYGGTYTLSWTGTALARYAINSATPAGAYAASPITITGQTAGATMSVEFGNGASSGTLGLVQLERGSVATPFEWRPFTQELALCMRYCIAYRATGANQRYGLGSADTLATVIVFNSFPVVMRDVPTMVTSALNTFACGTTTPLTSLAVTYTTAQLMAIKAGSTSNPWTLGYAYQLFDQGGASFIVFSAEL